MTYTRIRPLGVCVAAACVLAFHAVFTDAHLFSQGRSEEAHSDIEQFRGRPVKAREVLVQFTESLPEEELAQLRIQVDSEEDETLNSNGVKRFRSKHFDVETLVSFLESLPNVEYAEPNYIVSIDAKPNDPQFSQEWGLWNTTAPAIDIGATSAWNITTGSTGQVVGIVDTGIDYNHPDLVANLWKAPVKFTVTIGGKTITCNAGAFGYDALTDKCDPIDKHKHGTHVSGIVGAKGNNGTGISGVNWNVRLMALKFIDATGTGTISNAIKAIEFAIQAKQKLGAAANIQVLSNSWGHTTYSSALLNQINKANTNGMLFVAAAGNNGWNLESRGYYPAAYTASNVLTVAATDRYDQKPVFSNYGSKSVDLGAPGSQILSTIRGGTYMSMSGTSMATAHVSGAAALVLSKCALSTSSLKSVLLSTVTKISSLSGITVTGGRLNVYKALQKCTGT